jgi:hypothetical protein
MYYKRGDFDIKEESIEAVSSERERAVSMGAENMD